MQWPHWHWLQKKHGHLHVALRGEAKTEGEQCGKPHLVGKIWDRLRQFGTVVYCCVMLSRSVAALDLCVIFLEVGEHSKN